MLKIITKFINKTNPEENICELCHTPTRLHSISAFGRNINLCSACCNELNIPITDSHQNNMDADQIKLINATPAERSHLLTQMALNYAIHN